MYRVRFFRGSVTGDEGLAKAVETFLNEGIQDGYELERIDHASSTSLLTVLVVLKVTRDM